MREPKAAVMWLMLLGAGPLLEAAAANGAGQLGKGPLKVFILAGQSNMVGSGKSEHIKMAAAAPGKDGEPFRAVLDAGGNVIERKDVWIYNGGRAGNLKMGGRFGPEYGFGWYMGEHLKNQVLLIKTAWGGHSLKEKFLPPSAGGPGPSYTEMVSTVHKVLDNLKTHFPQYDGRGYEVVGLVWHQAWNDMIDRGQRGEKPSYKTYSERQAMLIKDLRKEFKSPGMLMTIGECGVGGEGSDKHGFRKAQERTALMPDLQKTVAFVKTAHFWDTDPKYASNQGYHYNNSGRTFLRKGLAFGAAMYDMMPKITLEDLPKYVDENSKPAYQALRAGKYPEAYEALKKFETVYQANVQAKKLGEEALEMQETVLTILKRKIVGPVEGAIAEIEGLKTSGDVYRLSVVFPKHHKDFAGIEKFDQAAGSIEKELKTSEARSAIATGRRFYAFIDKVIRVESKLKPPRSEANIRAITRILKQFAQKEKDNIYGKAAEIAAEKIADPKHVVTSATDYIQAVR